MPRKASQEQIEHARELKGMGKRISEIMQLTGLSRATVKKYTDEAEKPAPEPPKPAPVPVPPTPQPEPLAARAVKVVKEAVQEVVAPKREDPRPQAWLEILTAHAEGEPPPKRCRIHADPHFTGRSRVDQVKVLVASGKSPGEAARIVLDLAMDENRGRKHYNW